MQKVEGSNPFSRFAKGTSSPLRPHRPALRIAKRSASRTFGPLLGQSGPRELGGLDNSPGANWRRHLATTPCRTGRYRGSSLVPRRLGIRSASLGPCPQATDGGDHRFGLDDQEVHYPAADARSLHRQCRRPWLARTALSHVARDTRPEVTGRQLSRHAQAATSARNAVSDVDQEPAATGQNGPWKRPAYR
jgi:hypothetical protein